MAAGGSSANANRPTSSNSVELDPNLLAQSQQLLCASNEASHSAAAAGKLAGGFAGHGGKFSPLQVPGGSTRGAGGVSEIRARPISHNSASEQPASRTYVAPRSSLHSSGPSTPKPSLLSSFARQAIRQGVALPNSPKHSSPQSRIQDASAVTVTTKLKKQCQTALHQCLQLAVYCFKHRHNPMALSIPGNSTSLDLCDQIKKCLAVVNAVDGTDVGLGAIPMHAVIERLYVSYGLCQSPSANLRLQTLQAAFELVTIASDIQRYLCVFVGPDSTLPNQLKNAIEQLDSLCTAANQGLASAGCFGLQHRKWLLQVDSIEFLNPYCALIESLADVQKSLSEIGEPSQFELARKFGKFPDALAAYMLEYVAVVTCLTDPHSQDLFGYEIDNMGLSSYSSTTLSYLDFAADHQALPAHFGGKFRFDAAGTGENKAFFTMMANLNACEKFPDKTFIRLFYKRMSECIENNNFPSFLGKDGSVPKVLREEIKRTPIQNVLQNLLFSVQVTEAGTINQRPHTAKQLIMLSCISTKAFATALFLQAEHMLGEGELKFQNLPENPPQTYDTAQQQLVNYIYARHRSVNQNS